MLPDDRHSHILIYVAVSPPIVNHNKPAKTSRRVSAWRSPSLYTDVIRITLDSKICYTGLYWYALLQLLQWVLVPGNMKHTEFSH